MDQGIQDSFGHKCNFYKNFPERCGSGDNGNFVASIICCPCGGGNNPPTPSECKNTNYDALDSFGYNCDFYDNFSDRCGSADDSEFTASIMCCACGGGSAPYCETLENYFKSPCYLHTTRYACIGSKEMRNFELKGGNNILDSPCAWCGGKDCLQGFGNKCEPIAFIMESAHEIYNKTSIEFCARFDLSDNVPNRGFFKNKYYIPQKIFVATKKQCTDPNDKNIEIRGISTIVPCAVFVFCCSGFLVLALTADSGPEEIFIGLCSCCNVLVVGVVVSTLYFVDYQTCKNLDKWHPTKHGLNFFVVYNEKPEDIYIVFDNLDTYNSSGKCTIYDDPWPEHRRILHDDAFSKIHERRTLTSTSSSLGSKLFDLMGVGTALDVASVIDLSFSFYEMYAGDSNEKIPIRCTTDAAVSCFYWLSCTECTLAFDEGIFTSRSDFQSTSIHKLITVNS